MAARDGSRLPCRARTRECGVDGKWHAVTFQAPYESARVPAVRANGLVKHFETTCAVDEVGIILEEGEVRGLLGPNGAGKTTLLRLLFGLVHPDAGSIELLGRPGTHDLNNVGGFVEEPTFYPYLSGRSNLEILSELDGGGEQRIDEVLERVGLERRADDRVSGYSTGMTQRLGIAAALLRAPGYCCSTSRRAALTRPEDGK